MTVLLACPALVAQRQPGPASRTDLLVRAMSPTVRERARIHARSINSTRDIVSSRESVRITVEDRIPTRSSEHSLLRELTCGSDAAFVATVGATAVHPTITGNFLFSDNAMTVVELLRAEPGVPIREGEVVVLSRPGGETTIDGELMLAWINTHPPLMPGARYLVFADYNRQAAAFFQKESWSIFETSGAGMQPVYAVPLAAASAAALTARRGEALAREIECGQARGPRPAAE